MPQCDGQTPCGRCTSQKDVECVYEVPVRQSKENMRAEIEQLRTQQRRSERILAALVSDERPEQFLYQLRNGESLESITGRLDKTAIMSTVSGENVTTYNRISDHGVIGSALKPAGSIVNPLLPIFGFGDNHGTTSQLQAQQDP